jgi:type IX secretion system PorP/SprF family membrane protein
MKIVNKIFITIALMGFAGKAAAQLNAAGSQYYVNRYIANPAMAGFGEGLRINAGYRTLWNNIPGAPVSQNLTGEYGFEKVGLGLSLYNERAGLFRQTRAVATYAYHLNLNNGSRLHFGLSAGVLDQRVNSTDIVGSGGDIVIGEYNDRELYFDGDFGTAYTHGKFNVEAALPNLKRLFRQNTQKVADEATFMPLRVTCFRLAEMRVAWGWSPSWSLGE